MKTFLVIFRFDCDIIPAEWSGGIKAVNKKAAIRLFKHDNPDATLIEIVEVKKGKTKHANRKR